MQISNILLTLILLFFMTAPAGVLPWALAQNVSSPAVTSTNLKTLIDQKSEELQQIQNQKEEVQKNLDEIAKSSRSLKGEIQTINNQVNQLNLSIKANKIIIDKLGLEIKSTDNEIGDLEQKIINGRITIGRFFQELQQKDQENLFVIFLKGGSLSKSVSEVRSISLLTSGLSKNIQELKGLQSELADKLSEVQVKKKNREVERTNLINRQYIVQDQKETKRQLFAQTQNQEKTYEQQLTAIEKTQADISAEIEKIEAELRKHIDPALLPIPRPGVLAIPVLGLITQDYGYTAFAKYGYKGRFHNGTDIGAPIGTPVFAAEKGKVLAVGDQDRYCRRGAYGKFIVIQHENNLTTLYAHLSRQIVKKGDKVERGDLIGYVGRTGYATGPHLHLTVYAGPTFYMGTSPTCGPMPFGGDLNPAQYLE